MTPVILIFLFFCCLDAGTEAQCHASDVKCNGINACVSQKYVCDLIDDCPERDDERNCVFQDSGCGSPVYQTGINGSFTSINYQQSYNENAICKWLIQVPNGQTVNLQFERLFDLQLPRSGGCLSGRVSVYQYEPNLKMIGSYCGEDAPPNLTIDSSRVLVQFLAEEQAVQHRIKITWRAVSQHPPSTQIPIVLRNLQCAQEVKLRGQKGSIESPVLTDVNAGSPAINCRWQIQVDAGHFVLLSFSYVFLGGRCDSARLEIYDGPDSKSQQLLSTCGNHPPANVTTSSNYLYISMNITDDIRSNKWFEAFYSQTLTRTLPSGCDGVARKVSSQSGWISSPNFDGITPYRSNLNCQWNFEAPNDKYYEFTFTFFKIEASSVYCKHDYLLISENKVENNQATTKELKTLCGYDLPFDIIPSSSNVVFNFHTDQIIQSVGFNVTYVIKPKLNNCDDNQFRCRSGMCTMKSVVCDGKVDCVDGSEEYICPYTPSCGSTPIGRSLTSARIVGGNVAKRGSWPWAVSVLLPSGEHICGGTLIDLQWVLTAAHCFTSAISRAYTGYSIVAGRFQINVVDRNEQHRSFDKVFVPANFNKTTFEDDIALIRLASPFLMTNYVRPVCMPRGPVTAGTYGWIVGWGATNTDSCCQGRLKEASVPVINQSVCRQEDYYGNNILDHMMCAGISDGGRDSCKGDSGGPFVIRRGRNGPWEVQGVTSAGNRCAVPKKPGIYTRVWDYMSWIQETIVANY